MKDDDSNNTNGNGVNSDRVRETKPADYYTYADYLGWDDGQRYELIDGVVYNMSPAPSRSHQKILGAIFHQFYDYLSDKKCEVYMAPFDVRFSDGKAKHNEDNNTIDDKNIYTVVQPDLLVVCDEEKLDERGCKGAPDLVVEIVSPSSGRRDRSIKRELYEKQGVKEYWIVDYHEKTVEVYRLDNSFKYIKPDVYGVGDSVPVGIFKDFKVKLEQVFQ